MYIIKKQHPFAKTVNDHECRSALVAVQYSFKRTPHNTSTKKPLIFTYCWENEICHIVQNNSRWRTKELRGILHPEIYASHSPTVPMFQFYFVICLYHFLSSSKVCAICKNQKKPLKYAKYHCSIFIQWHIRAVSYIMSLRTVHIGQLFFKVWKMEGKTITVLWRTGKDVGKY